MKKRYFFVIFLVVILLLSGCDSNSGQDGFASKIPDGYPKIEELDWSFRNTVRYDEPVAVFDYVNNSSYTIVEFAVQFKMKDGVTSAELNLIDILTGEPVSDEEIPNMKPYVYDSIVCDPGETAEGANCFMVYNTYPTSTAQCELMELDSAQIYYIGSDKKIHCVYYSAENEGYEVSERTKEPYTWREHEFSNLIPIPETRFLESEDYKGKLYIDAYDITYEYFLRYISECEMMGFENKYPNEDIGYSYRGVSSDGYELSVRFTSSMHRMEVSVEKS